MAIKDNTGRWHSKKYAKRVFFFMADFAVFWVEQEVMTTSWLQNPFDIHQRCLFSVWVGSDANSPWQEHAWYPNSRKMVSPAPISSTIPAFCDARSRPPQFSFLLSFFWYLFPYLSPIPITAEYCVKHDGGVNTPCARERSEKGFGCMIPLGMKYNHPKFEQEFNGGGWEWELQVLYPGFILSQNTQKLPFLGRPDGP